MTPVYELWNEACGAEIIAEHDHLEGATLVILHALQKPSVTSRSPPFR